MHTTISIHLPRLGSVVALQFVRRPFSFLKSPHAVHGNHVRTFSRFPECGVTDFTTPSRPPIVSAEQMGNPLQILYVCSFLSSNHVPRSTRISKRVPACPHLRSETGLPSRAPTSSPGAGEMQNFPFQLPSILVQFPSISIYHTL
jgi:hypothetical protein